MSFTTVSKTETRTTPRPRILLSPSKWRRISYGTHEERSHETHVTEKNDEEEPLNVEEIWKWTMTPDSVAICFARDVFDMKENLIGGADFYWLGRVPCRSVCLVGLVVGLQVFESKVLYSIDDGTAVIDCVHKVSRLPKKASKHSNYAKTVREMPRPIAHIGLPMRVFGKVQRAYGTRQILVDEIELCKSANEEPLHWIKVRELHRMSYDLDKPFVIPPPVMVPVTSVITEPTTPSTVASSRASSVVANSPVKVSLTKSSPPKLRHPSRLHSRDLTDNTFRIYVKHYMVHAPTAMPEATDDEFELDALANEPTTPTKRSANVDQFRTPMPASRKMAAVDQTPRLRSKALVSDADRNKTGELHPSPNYGFTLSYLRRVPELADMARRVVTAEAKRRDREQRKKEGEGRSKGSTSRTISSAAVALDLSKDKIGPKMKRLFKWAIVQLLHEGSIVLWDGALRPCILGNQREISGMWKTSTSISTAACADSAVLDFSGEARHGTLTDEFSDPEMDEEGYMPITSTFLGDYVEDVMRKIAADGKQKAMSRMSTTCTPPGTTKEKILACLHRDDRWRFIGEWQVQEALEYLGQESRAWRVGNRWELTL